MYRVISVSAGRLLKDAAIGIIPCFEKVFCFLVKNLENLKISVTLNGGVDLI